MSTRPYLIRDADTGGRRLVRSATKSGAIAHVVRARFIARPVTAAELLDLLEEGLQVETVDTRQAEIETDVESKPPSSEASAPTPEPADAPVIAGGLVGDALAKAEREHGR